MKITLKDGVIKEYESALSVLDIAKSISEGLARNACAGKVNGEVVDLRHIVDADCDVEILTFNDEEGTTTSTASSPSPPKIWLPSKPK